MTKFCGFSLLGFWAWALLAITPVNAAIITYTADEFNLVTDISTSGTLVRALNLGNTSTAVTVNSVVFAADNSAFFTNNPGSFGSTELYAGGAIDTLTLTETNSLLRTLEFATGVNNSLARLTGLTIGQSYLLQMIVVDARATSSTASYGYAAVSGSPIEVYPLMGLSTKPTPYVITGLFTADETSQDVHVAGAASSNGLVNAFQLRAVETIPEPGSVALVIGMASAAIMFYRRKFM